MSEEIIEKQNIIDKHYFANSQIYSDSLSNSPTVRAYTKEQVERFLRDPMQNYQSLQSMSNYLFSISSAYKNIIDYFSTILAFDYVLVPTSHTDNEKAMMNRFLNAAKKAKQSQVKSTFSKLLARTLLQGESYWYVLTDNDNTIYVEIPASYCEVCEIDSNNLIRYKVKLNLLNDNVAKSLPEEIQNAYNHFKTNRNSGRRKTTKDNNDPNETNKYAVSENGFALLAHGLLSLHDYPYFANSFIDILQLEENKEYLNSNIRDDAIKMIHNKIACDDNGIPIMPENVIRAYHEADKKHVPKNVSVSTTPFEKEAISFNESNKTQINLVEQSKKNVQDDSGISSLIFNNEKASSNALSMSIRADANRMLPFLKFFNAILSYQLKPFKFAAVFLETDRFNKNKDHEDARTDLQNGGSKSLFVATSKLEIYDFIQLAKLERVIGMENYMPIMIPGSQQSGKPNGRPKTEEPSDGEEVSREYD